MIRVGPRGLFARRRYGAGAIGLALALWAVFGREPAEVRDAVSPWRKVAVETKTRWPSLLRWAIAARDQQLWPTVRPGGEHLNACDAAAGILRALVAALPDSTLGAISEAQVFAAAQLAGGPA